MREKREAAIAAALILAGFMAAALLLPRLMRFLGDFSTLAAGAAAVIFVAAFFLVFWLRAMWQRRKGR